MIAVGRVTERRIDGNAQGQVDELATTAGTSVERLTDRSAAAPARVARGLEAEVTGGLTRRMAVASGLLALIGGAAFAVLLVSVTDLRTSERLARHSEQVLAQPPTSWSGSSSTWRPASAALSSPARSGS